MSKFRRRTFLIDTKMQGALVFRVLAYWMYCLFTTAMLLIWWDVFNGPARPFLVVVNDVYLRFAPAAAASMVVVPLVVMDLLRMSNRFVGPARRLQGVLREVGEGKQVPPLMFRDSDYWQEMAAQFNRVNDRINQLVDRQARSQSPPANPEDANQEIPELAGRED